MTREPVPARHLLLAIDTSTARVVVALGRLDGSLVAERTWTAGYRHGETLLPAVAGLLDERGLGRTAVAGVVVGTGPGTFSGLRVGFATAKGLAHGLGCPIVAVPSGEALLAAAAALTPGMPAGRFVLVLPAGPSDRVIVRPGAVPVLVPGGTEPGLAPDAVVVAVDLPDRADADALTRGEAARAGLAVALLRLGAARLGEGAGGELTGDDLAGLVPEYVTLPRGVHAAPGEVSWSHGPR
jgi:tRNA threonylcarbamoyl adenosine modification protein YeaZ